MKKIFIFFVFLVVFVFSVQSQTITGVVTEMIGNNKEPIMGVNVVVVNSTSRYLKGTVTNLNGVYTLDIPKDLITDISLRFSYIGMETKTVKYNGQKILNVTLSTASTTTIKEVQVVGTRTDRDGFGVSKLEQTAATQKIQMSEIVEHEPVSSIEEALQGRLTGVDIAVSGDPGSKSSIRIRGTSSLTSNDEPLIVVDGVPYNTSTDNMNWATANEEDFGALLNISPATIESIEVLKDASATAVYGTKGANGVILINTKKGTMGKTRFSFSTKFTAKFEPSSIPLLNGDQYTSLMQDAIWNAANAKGVTSASTEMYNLFHADEILFNKEYQYFNEYNQSTNWLEEIRRNAYISDNTFSMNGGGEKATYRFNLGYYKEQGTTKGTDLNRLNTSFNIVYRFSDRIKVTTDVNYTDTKKYSNYESDVRSVAQKRMPPVPTGVYEIRIAYPPMYRGGLMQFYIGTSSSPASMQALGLPLDARLPIFESEAAIAMGWTVASDEIDYGVSTDVVLRNNGYMRGPCSYSRGTRNTITAPVTDVSLIAGDTNCRTETAYGCQVTRRIVTRMRLKQSENYWFRIKNLITDDKNLGWTLDYIELVPISIVDNQTYIEDWY